MVDTTRRVAGTAFLSIDGRRYALVGELTYLLRAEKRETLVGQESVHGYSEKVQQGVISAKLRSMANVDIGALNAMTNVTVIAELANGKTVMGRNMWVVELSEVNTEDGSFTIKFESDDVQEI